MTRFLDISPVFPLRNTRTPRVKHALLRLDLLLGHAASQLVRTLHVTFGQPCWAHPHPLTTLSPEPLLSQNKVLTGPLRCLIPLASTNVSHPEDSRFHRVCRPDRAASVRQTGQRVSHLTQLYHRAGFKRHCRRQGISPVSSDVSPRDSAL